MPDLLVENCMILQCREEETEILHGHGISIDNDRIVAIKPESELARDEHREILDGKGMLAMPGLINTHAHAPMVIFRGLAEDVNIETWFNEYLWPLESNLQEEDVYWGMQLALVEMLEAGVTSVCDHYFHMDRVAEAVEQAGTRAALGWAVFGNQGTQALDQSADFVTRWQGGAEGRISTWMAPHAPYTCDDDFLRAAAQKAEQLGVGIHIHVSETKEQTDASLEKFGRTPIQILSDTGVLNRPTILAHACGATPEDIELLASNDCAVAHAPKTYLKLAMGAAPVLAMRKAGIPVGLATDGAVSNNTLDIWESMRLLAMVQKHASHKPENLSVPQALYIATRESARVFGLPDDLGHLSEGYLADIILVDLNGAHHQPRHDLAANLLYSARASDVQTVLVAGRVLMRDRQLLTLDKSQIFEKVRTSMRRLSDRTPERRIQVYEP